MFIGSARTPKPWISDVRASKNFSRDGGCGVAFEPSAASVAERGLERSLRQGHEEPRLEHEKERDRDQDRNRHDLVKRILAEPGHEEGDEDRGRHVEAEKADQ